MSSTSPCGQSRSFRRRAARAKAHFRFTSQWRHPSSTRCVLIDCDPQGTVTAWAAEAERPSPSVIRADPFVDRAACSTNHRAAGFGLAVLDCPPHAAAGTDDAAGRRKTRSSSTGPADSARRWPPRNEHWRCFKASWVRAVLIRPQSSTLCGRPKSSNQRHPGCAWAVAPMSNQ